MSVQAKHRALGRRPRRAPSVAVVLPVLDEGALIEAQLDDLLARADIAEVLVVDGGSRDATVELVAARLARRSPEERPRLVLLEAPRGRALQMNAGARAAASEVVLFLHCDVRLPPDAVPIVRGALSGIGVIAGAFRTHTVASPRHPRARSLRWLLRLADLRSRYTRHPYGDQALFVWRDELLRAGGVPALPILEDLALSRVLRTRGRLRTVRSCVRVSGRRFQEAPLRYTLLVNLLPFLHWAGVRPSVLQGWYEDVR